jgi:exodeoxyribonuclease V gamma subunit
MLDAWLKSLLAAAGGVEATGIVVGRDATVHIQPMPAEAARRTLAVLIEAWRAGLSAPLPLPFRTALGFVTGGDPAVLYEGNHQARGEAEEPCLARLYPDFATLAADGRFAALARTVHAPLAAWLETQVSATPHPQAESSAEEHPA